MSATPVLDLPGVFAEAFLFITTRVTLDVGSDRKLPPGRELWMTTPLRTIAEHLYDHEQHARTHVLKTGQCRREGTRSGYVATTARQTVATSIP